jgi:hypothetical protein
MDSWLLSSRKGDVCFWLQKEVNEPGYTIYLRRVQPCNASMRDQWALLGMLTGVVPSELCRQIHHYYKTDPHYCGEHLPFKPLVLSWIKQSFELVDVECVGC